MLYSKDLVHNRYVLYLAKSILIAMSLRPRSLGFSSSKIELSIFKMVISVFID